jgi:tyrosine aminotransferase
VIQLRNGLVMLAQKIVGPNSLIQGALPDILKNVPESYFQELNHTLEDQAKFCVEKLSGVAGLKPVSPQGTMYIMVEVLAEKFPDIQDDVEFCSKLLSEERVMLLPGKAFGMDNFFRIVFCGPKAKLGEAVERISEFCNRHMKATQ